MKRSPWSVPFLIALSLTAAGLRADVDVSEYQTRDVVRSEAERRKLRTEFEQERQAERLREQAQAQEEEARQAAEAASLSTRPWPERLTEERCTVCHPATNYALAGHAWPGWLVVTLRMRFFNEAPLTWPEQWTIVAHLTETYPADTETIGYEWGATLASMIGVIWLMARCIRWSKNSSNRKEPLNE